MFLQLKKVNLKSVRKEHFGYLCSNFRTFMEEYEELFCVIFDNGWISCYNKIIQRHKRYLIIVAGFDVIKVSGNQKRMLWYVEEGGNMLNRQKVIPFFFLTFMVFLFSCHCCYAQEENIFLYEDGYSLIDLENQPFMEDHTLYIPMEEIVEHFHTGKLNYDLPNIVIDHRTAYDGNAHMVFTLNSAVVTINGAVTEMDQPLIQKGDCVYLPIQYISWLDLENAFQIQYEQHDDGLHVYLRNTALSKEQLQWQNKTFGLEKLSENETNIVDFSSGNHPMNFTWQYAFQTEEENDFADYNGKRYITSYITSNNRCKFYRDADIYAVSIPFQEGYEITLICSDTINDEMVNQIYKYRDAKIEATSVSIPKFAVEIGNSTYVLDERGFHKEDSTSDESIEDIYLPVDGVADYCFQKPFYFLITDQDISTILKGWVGYVEGKEADNPTKTLQITIEMNNDMIYVNGVEKDLREPAYISKNGYTMLPVREVAEIFPETNVLWNSDHEEASISVQGDQASVIAGANSMYINQKYIPLKNTAEVHNGRMFISLRDVCQICSIPDEDIVWDRSTKTVYIDTERVM